MKLPFELPAPQAENRASRRSELSLSPEDLASAALTDLLAMPDAEFQAVAARCCQESGTLTPSRLIRYLTLGEVVALHRPIIESTALAYSVALNHPPVDGKQARRPRSHGTILSRAERSRPSHRR